MEVAVIASLVVPEAAATVHSVRQTMVRIPTQKIEEAASYCFDLDKEALEAFIRRVTAVLACCIKVEATQGC